MLFLIHPSMSTLAIAYVHVDSGFAGNTPAMAFVYKNTNNQSDHRYCHDWGINGEKLTLVNADVIHIDQRALFSLPLSYRAIQTDVGEKRSDFKGSALSIVTEKLDIY